MDNQQGPHIIPANLMRMVTLDARADTRDTLVQFLLAEPGTIELTPKQKVILERVTEADRLIRTGRYKQTEIEALLVQKYKYSRESAKNDINNAEHIFGSSRPRNKRYLISNHIDFIDTCMRAAYNAGDMKTLGMLIAEKTRALKELPDNAAVDTAPAAIIFNFEVNNIGDLTNIEVNEHIARKTAIEYLSKEEITDIDHEDLDL